MKINGFTVTGRLEKVCKNYNLIIPANVVTKKLYSRYEEHKNECRIIFFPVIFDEIHIGNFIIKAICYEVFIEEEFENKIMTLSGWPEGSIFSRKDDYFFDDKPILLPTDDEKEYLKWKLMI